MIEQGDISGQLFDLMSRLKEKKEAIQRELEQVDKDIESVNNTLRLVRIPKTKAGELLDLLETIQPSYAELRGKTHIQALIVIAKANKNLLKISEAKDILARVGLMKSPKNGWTIVYNTIKRSNRFVATDKKGEWRLTDDENQPATLTEAG